MFGQRAVSVPICSVKVSTHFASHYTGCTVYRMFFRFLVWLTLENQSHCRSLWTMCLHNTFSYNWLSDWHNILLCSLDAQLCSSLTRQKRQTLIIVWWLWQRAVPRTTELWFVVRITIVGNHFNMKHTLKIIYHKFTK